MKNYELMEVNDNIKELLGTKYDSLFKTKVRSKGISYSRNNKVSDIDIKKTKVSAKVTGSNIYDVEITFNKEEIKNVKCTCPYYEKDKYCKHVYSVLYELSKDDKEEAYKRYKKYVTHNAKQVNNFFMELNDVIKCNKNNFSKEFFKEYEDIYYDLNGKYTNLKLDKKELSQLDSYLTIINNDYKKLCNIKDVVNKKDNINYDVKKYYSIQDKIYKEDITIDELIELKLLMNDYSFDKSDLEYVDDRINTFIEETEKIEDLNNIYLKLKENKLSTETCSRMIRRLKGINENDVSSLDKNDLEYFLYNTEDLNVLLAIKANMNKYDFEKEDYEYITGFINDIIDSIIDVKKLKDIKQKMKSYKLDLTYINEAIYNAKYKIYKPSSDPMLRGLEEQIEALPLEVLETIRLDNIKNNKDTAIMDKAIANKKRKIKEEQKQIRKEAFHGLLKAITSIGSIFTSNKSETNYNKDYSDIERSEIESGNYEPYQFEEEDLEEDDYYSEDLD